VTVKIEVIPWEAKAGQFGIAIARDGRAEAYFVGSRSEAEREARRQTGPRRRSIRHRVMAVTSPAGKSALM
jgi:hypothetical protein